MSALLTASSIQKSFAGVRALKGVTFALEAGEVHALVGENGAGKSTLIRIITGADRADAGALAVDGRSVDLSTLTPAGSRALGIAPIYQQPALFPHLSVSENIALALEPASFWRPIDWRARRMRARDLLHQAGAAFDPECLAGSLSMPEQQLVEIARAVGANARIILMDEPTASLTDREVARLFDVIASLRRRGAGIIYISHRLDEVFGLADRISVLRDGETVATGEGASFTREQIVRHMAGRDLPAVAATDPAPQGEVVFEVCGLSSASAGIRDVSLSVHQGEILGIAGLVGSGRTELAEVIFGLRRAESGVITIGGMPVAIDNPRDAIAHKLAYLPEDRRRHGVVVSMSVAANTSLALLPVMSTHGLLDRSAERALADRFVRSLQIKTPSTDADVGTLSGGNQQKVALARWLATDPRVLILDEPTQGVDVGAKAEIHAVIRTLAGRGIAIILISSELPEILSMSDRVAVMRGGAIAAVLDRGAATAERILAVALTDVATEPTGVSH